VDVDHDHDHGETIHRQMHATCSSAKTPREARNRIRYVLLNRKHHAAEKAFAKCWIDPHSSTPWFDGWAGAVRTQVCAQLVAQSAPTARAKSWLLATGWRRHGPLAFDERPG
jgi:hypothetical protein